MAWTIAKDSGAVSFTHWLGNASEDGIQGRMGTAEGALALKGGHVIDPDNAKSQFEVFPGQSKSLYDDLFLHMPMMVIVLDGDGMVTAANKATKTLLGIDASEIVGKHCLDLLTWESSQLLRRDVLPKFFEDGYFSNVPAQFVGPAENGVDTFVSAIGYKNQEGRIERSVVLFTDMTDTIRAQAALRQSEQRFRSSFESAAHGMAVLTLDGRFNSINSAFVEMLGSSESMLLTKSLMDLLHQDDISKVHDIVNRIRLGGVNGGQAELRYRLSEDKWVIGLTSISGVSDEHGEIEQFVVQTVDMTGRQKAEEHLRQAQKMEAVGQLTGGIAHDFNNLLTVVIGNLQLIENAVKGNEKAEKRAKEAIQAATKGSDLTKQLLAFARRQSLAPCELEVNQLIADMEGLLLRSVGEAVELKLDLDETAHQVEVDPTQLETSILNLAINARDAMGKNGGRLTIETTSVYLDAEYALEHEDVKPGSYVMIAVSDTGSGIPKHLLHKVFQPFFTTKEVGKGTGLGLSMVFGFIKQSGGHMKVYSEEDRGTSFKLYLPRQLAEGEEPVTPVEPEEKKPQQKTQILVVDDQDDVREVAVAMLEDFGYDVICAADAIEALQMLQDYPDVALLFTDVVMPGGMNGFDLSQAAEQIRPDLKVIHASGYPKGAMVHQEEPRLRDSLISKPFQRDELMKVVADTLGDLAAPMVKDD